MTEETQATGAAAATGDATGAQGTPPAPNGGEEKRFSQADLDRLIKERLDRERDKAEKTAAKAREESEAASLAEQQKWQELAEKHGKKATTLEESLAAEARARAELEEKATRYQGALDTFLKVQKEGLPAHILGLLDKLDPVEQLNWIAENREALGKPAAAGGIPATPAAAAPASSSTPADASKRQKELSQQIRSWM